MNELSGEKFEEKPNIEELKSKISFGIKFWLEFESEGRKNILGSGWAIYIVLQLIRGVWYSLNLIWFAELIEAATMLLIGMGFFRAAPFAKKIEDADPSIHSGISTIIE